LALRLLLLGLSECLTLLLALSLLGVLRLRALHILACLCLLACLLLACIGLLVLLVLDVRFILGLLLAVACVVVLRAGSGADAKRQCDDKCGGARGLLVGGAFHVGLPCCMPTQ
jgi:hypothetical protein